MSRPATGSIRHVNGVWKVRASIGVDRYGKRIQQQVTCRTEREAERVLADLLASRNEHHARSVGRLLDEYHAATTNRRSARSDVEVRHHIDVHLKPLHRIMVKDLDVETIEQLYNRLRIDFSDGTVRHIHYVLRPAIRLAVRWGWRPDNPAELVDLGPLDRMPVNLPADDAVQRLLAECCRRGPLGLFVRLAIVTGARRGELAAFRWRDVDWTAPTITVRASLSETRGQVIVKQPKTASSARTIGIDSDTIAQLAAHRADNDNDNDDGFIFGGEKPISPSAWSKRFAAACRHTNVEMRLHDLRHWTASALITAGIPINAVAARLGHARTSTTVDVYGHLLAHDDSALAGVVLNRFSQPSPSHALEANPTPR